MGLGLSAAVGLMKITKLDAARRQLRTAIELWFEDGEPVSIHALAFASHEIIHRLFRQQGLKDLMFDSSKVKDEYRKEWADLLKEDANFFKHAERETKADDAREFNPLANDLFLLMSMSGLQRMNVILNDIESAFLSWHIIHRPDWFIEDRPENRIPIEHLEQLRRFSKSDFLKGFLAGRKMAANEPR